MKIMKNLLLLAFVAMSFPIDAQLDLSSMQGLDSILSDEAESDQETDRDSIQEGKDETYEKDRAFLEKDSQEENFGYSQKQSFINSPQEKFFDEPLIRFGYDLFIDAPTTFAPATDIPIPPDYIIGPGDNIKIIYFGNKNQKTTLQVNREGEIFFPELGPISVAGLTFSEMKKSINEIVSKQFIGTQINISLGELRSINVFLLGEVFQPGLYTISSLSTLTNAIFSSGGIRSKGSLRNIQLKRKGQVISTFDFYDLLLQGDTSKDSTLMPGDVIFIPPVSKTVAIAGEVRRAGIYELKDDETIEDLIRFSGSFTPKADLKSIEIQSIDTGNNGFTLNEFNFISSGKEDRALKNGDLINIFPVIDSMNNAVLISGHAQKPGFYPWKKGLSLGDIIQSASDLLPLTDINFGLIKREDEINRSFDVIQFDLDHVFSGESKEILLQEKDEIIFFPKFLSLDLLTAELMDVELLSPQQKRELSGILTEEMKLASLRNPSAQDQDEEDESDSEELKDLENDRFYEYKVYQYCDVETELAEALLAPSQDTKLSLMNKDRTSSKTETEQLQSQNMINNNMQSSTNPSERMGLEIDPSIDRENFLTDICRRHLLKPVIDMVNRNLSPLEPRKLLSIHGNIFFPGEYPYSSDMDISDLIKAAGGLKDNTYTEGIEIISTRIDGKQTISQFSSSSSSMDETMSSEVNPLDVVNVKKISREIEMVNISGQVYFPGEYPISKDESLADLIKRAGGLKSQAFSKGTLFQRVSLKEAEKIRLEKARVEVMRRISLASASANVGQAELQGDDVTMIDRLLGDESQSDELVGRLVINLEGILSGSDEDVILEDGDSIFIPRIQQTVSVLGEVYAPNAHIFKKKKSIQEYIDLSGGSNEYADSQNIYIIKADGSIIPPSEIKSSGFFRAGYSVLGPGDAIVVPLKVSTFSALKASTEISQIVYQMAIAAAAVNSF